MRTVTYGAACSLDGFITDRDGTVDWLHFSRDVQQITGDYWKTIDTLVMGRKTYEVAASMGGDVGEMKGIKAYVFSRTLKSLPKPGAQLVSGDAGDFVRKLKRAKGKGICVFGGGDFARSLFEARVIDEVGLNIHPVLLGAGVPFFLDAGFIKLKLLENRTIGGGCVFVSYKVVK